MYGHVKTMAQKVKEGVDAAGAEGVLLQAPETLPAEVLAKMYAPPKDESIPIVDVHTLGDFDGIIFGAPTRYGMMAAQLKAVFDATGGLWSAGKLVGKPAGTFFSTATQGGGQETTALTMITQFVHHGMIYIPMGYTDGSMFDNSVLHGGSPYGPGTYANGDGSRQPSDVELNLCVHYGKHFTRLATALKIGKEASK